jgi:hypothetical protein
MSASSYSHAESLKDPPTCGQWMSQYNKNNTWDLSNKNWLVGFLSGMAFSSQKKILWGVNDTAIFHSVYIYCKANPDETIDFAAEEFYLELQKCTVPPPGTSARSPICKDAAE